MHGAVEPAKLVTRGPLATESSRGRKSCDRREDLRQLVEELGIEVERRYSLLREARLLGAISHPSSRWIVVSAANARCSYPEKTAVRHIGRMTRSG